MEYTATVALGIVAAIVLAMVVMRQNESSTGTEFEYRSMGGR